MHQSKPVLQSADEPIHREPAVMNADDIFAALERNNGTLPRGALKLAVENSDLITPKLLHEIEYSIDNIDKIHDDTSYMRHIYALFLLAQFRETRAYPLIVDFFSMPGDVVQHVTGDVITEDLGRILASTFDGDTAPLERLIEDRRVNEYVRSAALQALVILWGCEILARQQIIDYIHSLFTEKLAGEASFVWSALVAQSLNLSPDELEKDIEDAFDQKLIDPFYVGRSDFKESLGLSNEEALGRFKRDRRSGLIDNTISEMEWWACFQSQNRKMPSSASLKSNPGNRKSDGSRKIGRNDPCPCGSGKKYKKCCLHAEQTIV